MRLASKLLSSLALLTVLLLGLSAFIEHQHRDELLAMDMDAEGRMARTFRAVVQKVCEILGPAPAREVIATVNAKSPSDIRWLEPNEVAPSAGPAIAAEVMASMKTGEPSFSHRLNDGALTRYTYIPVSHRDGTPLAVIEASESMEPRSAFIARKHTQTAAVGLVVLALSGALAVVLGRLLIGRPVAQLAQSVRAFGDGDLAPPSFRRRRDELGTLATELSALGERLAERERLRHDDRLRTIGQLASGVGHELGTPLSVIAVRARLIASGEATGDEIVANATAIIEQAGRMTRLVRQLLDYSRRSAGQATAVDLKKASLQAVEMLEPLARTHAITVAAECEHDAMVVRGDAAQLQQVLTNLILNGIQASPPGGRLEVRCGRDTIASPGKAGRPVERCWLRVTDTGPGIPPDHLARVFEPFFTTKVAGEGTGLGLAVAQAIVEEHGGWIAVDSEEGRGAAFSVYLPPAAAETDARLAS